MAHPRSTCSHADQAASPAGISCRLALVPYNAHAGACLHCHAHSDPDAREVPMAAGEAERAEARAAVCDGCPEMRQVSRRVGNFNLFAVACRACGCGGVSLRTGSCPAGKW